MELKTEVRLLIILICMGMVVMVSESLTCNLQKLNFTLEEQVENHNDIIENGLFGFLPRGTGASSGPSQCRNYRSSNGSGGGPCADNQVNAELRVNAYPGLSCVGSNCSTIDPAKQHSSAMVA